MEHIYKTVEQAGCTVPVAYTARAVGTRYQAQSHMHGRSYLPKHVAVNTMHKTQ